MRRRARAGACRAGEELFDERGGGGAGSSGPPGAPSLHEQMARFEREVERFVRCVDRLEPDRFTTEVTRWSSRDIVAHLIGWNRNVIAGAGQILRGELPFYDVDPGENYAKVNAALVRKYPSEDRRELLGELRRSAAELTEFLGSLDETAWDRDFGARHRGEVLTIRSTVDDLIADYGHHRDQIAAWLEGRKPVGRK